MTDYSLLEDEKLVEQVQMHVEDANEITMYLLDKYKSMVRSLSKGLFLLGADQDDLLQEGMIGLCEAINTFKGEKATKFVTFATLCVQRQMYTAVDKANRIKHAPLNNYVSISIGEDSDSALEDVSIDGAILSPETLVVEQEFWKEFYSELETLLSDKEKAVLKYCREGMTYTQIAAKMGEKPKAIDNALQRIRKKVSKCSFHELGPTPYGVL